MRVWRLKLLFQMEAWSCARSPNKTQSNNESDKPMVTGRKRAGLGCVDAACNSPRAEDGTSD